jgi:hypothetical protein
MYMLLAHIHFGWVAFAGIASAAAAIGTLILAGFTKGLAKKTADMVTAAKDSVKVARDELEAVIDQAKATREQATLATKALQAELTPWLVPLIAGDRKTLPFHALDGAKCETDIGFYPKSWEDASKNDVWAIVPIRNVGRGPAFISTEPSAVAIHSAIYGGMTDLGRASSRVVAPGDGMHLIFHAPRGHQAGFTMAMRPEDAGAHMVVVVRYADINGDQERISRLVFRGMEGTELFDPTVTVEAWHG